MTRRLTVSVPDDVAEHLDGESNASAAVTDAVRAQMRRGAATAEMLRAAGFAVSEDNSRERGRLPRLTDDQRAASRRHHDLLRRRPGAAEPAG